MEPGVIIVGKNRRQIAATAGPLGSPGCLSGHASCDDTLCEVTGSAKEDRRVSPITAAVM